MVRAYTFIVFSAINLKIAGVVSGCIIVASLIAVIAVVAIAIGRRWRKKGKHLDTITVYEDCGI